MSVRSARYDSVVGISRVPVTLLALAVVLLEPVRALAQHIEISPFVGFKLAGEVIDNNGNDVDLNGPSAGVNVDIRIDDDLRLTLLFSRAWSEVTLAGTSGTEPRTFTVDTYHGGVHREVWRDKVRPFFGASIGLTRYDAGTLDAEPEYLFGVGASIGIKLFPVWWFGLRAEARGMANFAGSSSRIACGGGCVAFFDTDVLWLGEATVGVMIKF